VAHDGRMNKPKVASAGWTVRTRLMVGICLIVALGITAAGSAAFLIERSNALVALDTHLKSRINAAESIVLGPSSTDTTAPPTAFSSARAAARAVVAGIVPDSGESTFAMVDGKTAYVPGVKTTFELARTSTFVGRVNSETANGSMILGSVTTSAGTYRYIAAPITVAGDPTRAVFVMAASIDDALTGVYSQAATFALVSLITFLVVLALGWFISGRLLWPIVILTRTAERITSRNRSDRVPDRGNDDLSRLGRVMNGMLDRLDAELIRQRQLLDDVRHELNTPLTIVRGHLELVDVHDPVRVAATKELSIDELSRMTELVADLTRLAESENAPLNVEMVDVGAFTRGVHSKVSALDGHDWALADVASGIGEFDRSKITEAWLQLLENAGKYAPASSTITMGSSEGRAGWQLWVLDEGPGVPEGARERIFERFGRISSHRGIRGSGLGLPIVRAIARAHGGDVTVQSAGTGSRFIISIPKSGFADTEKD
jgi:two-component system OmpR family sensor kinase